MLNKKKISISLLAVALLIGGTSYYTLVYSKVTTSTAFARVLAYNNLDSLEKEADLVLVGSPTDDFTERDHQTTLYAGGKAKNTVQDFYTLTNFKIQKVIKSIDQSPLENKTIQVVEPVGLIQQLTGKVKMQFEDYSEMEKGKKYVVFLKKNGNGQYSIMSLSYGKYSMDNNDTKDVTNIDNRENIKKEIKAKYQL